MPTKEEEINAIKKKLLEVEKQKADEVVKEIIIGPRKLMNFIVRFNNLSPSLKTIVVFSWVLTIYFSIFFIAKFIVGIYS